MNKITSSIKMTYRRGCPVRYRHLALKMPRCRDLHLSQMSFLQGVTKLKICANVQNAIWRKYRDNISVEKTNPTTTRCPVRDNIWIEHIAYLTARPCSRIYSIFTNILSLTGCSCSRIYSISTNISSLFGILFRKECKRGLYFVRAPYH